MSFDDLFGAPEPPLTGEPGFCYATDGGALVTHRPGVTHKGNRMSSLPVVQYCPQAARLGAQYGSGRAAAMSRYFHARCAGVPCDEAVSAEELADIDTWHTPTDVTLWNGEVLKYEEARKEVALSYPGSGGEDGHLDFAWFRDGAAYVADIKKTRWTTLDGPESLQLMAYAIFYAEKIGAQCFCTGIFVAEDGEWQWLPRFIDVGSEEYVALRARVMTAAMNTEGQASTGSHCRGCYARLHCPEHMLAATTSIGWLSPIAEGHREATPEEYTRLLLAAQNLKEIAEKCIKTVQVLVDRGHVLKDEESGKVYKPIPCKGKEGITVKSLREQMGEEEANKYIKRGASYFQHRWVNP